MDCEIPINGQVEISESGVFSITINNWEPCYVVVFRDSNGNVLFRKEFQKEET